jgi:hypothetical protein
MMAALVLSLRQMFEGIRDGGDERFEIFKLQSSKTHPLDRLRERAQNAAQRRIGGKGTQKGLGGDQVPPCRDATRPR